MGRIKWDESMAQRCITRHETFLPKAWRNAAEDQDEASAGPAAEDDDDSCWTEFSEKIKKLAAKS